MNLAKTIINLGINFKAVFGLNDIGARCKINKTKSSHIKTNKIEHYLSLLTTYYSSIPSQKLRNTTYL